MAALAVTVLAGALMACSTEAPAVVPAPSASVPVALQRFYTQQLEWTPCHTRLECARFDVPLDYAKPNGATISIMAARVAATGTSRGALVINPGGPGGSGIEYISEPAYAVSATARRNFDLVSFDPRGVGESTPLWCFKGARLDRFLDSDPSPDTVAEGAAFMAEGKALANACKRENAALMAHVSAIEVARDMDVLRALLGETKLRYIGKSWGTVLGKVYASLFPGNVGAFVLDGAVNLELPTSRASYEQGLGFEQSLGRFAAWCAAQSRCALGATASAVKARIIAFVHGLDRKPMRTTNPARPLTEAQAITGIIGPLYIEDGGFDWLLTGITPAVTLHDGTALQTIADWFVERNKDGSYANNGNTAIYFMNCLDERGDISTPAQARALTASWSKTIPFMAATMAWSELTCAKWPVHAATDIASLRVRGVPPILVVTATHDPATPMPWARALVKQLPGAVLLTREGDGHTSYANGSACTDTWVDSFLLSDDPASPSLPPTGTLCDATTA